MRRLLPGALHAAMWSGRCTPAHRAQLLSAAAASMMAGYNARRAKSTTGGAEPAGFKAKGRVEGDGRGMSNPFADMHHLKQHHLILMCILCLTGGMAAGRFAEINEDELYKVRFEKDEIIAHFQRTFELRPDLAPTCLRLAFVMAARRGGVTAECIEESCSVPDGLVEVSQALNFPQVSAGLTTEDAVALAAIAAVKFLRGPWVQIPFSWNREDVEKAPARRTQKLAAPATDAKPPLLSLPFIMRHIGGLSSAESVALMACHGVGEFHEDVSGIDGVARLPRHYNLSNGYYKALLAYRGEFKRYPVHRTKENEPVEPLPTDFVSVNIRDKKKGAVTKCIFSGREVAQQLKDPEWLRWVEVFAADKAQWETHFAAAFGKMLDSNFRTPLRLYEADWKRTHGITDTPVTPTVDATAA